MYKFDESDAIRFSHHVGIQAKKTRSELIFKYCPYCKQSRTKDKNTFSINLNTGQFQCMRASCGQSGNMLTLSRDFDFSISTEIDEYLKAKTKPKKYGKFPKLTPTDPALAFMKERGISTEICTKYGITTHKDKKNVLIFPFVDDTNEIQLLKYRNMEYDGKGSKEWSQPGGYTILFGMQNCNLENDTIILTEGQIDSLSVSEAGFENALSVPTGKNGMTWFAHCFDFLQKFKKIIVFGDCERDEITLLEQMKTHFTWGQVFHVRQDDYLECKDANEILLKHGKDAIRNCIENAVMVEDQNIKQLSDVKRVSLSEMEKFTSIIGGVNETLGGFYFGQVCVLTGKRGNGKSTLASQFVADAVAQGYKSFCYSAEIADWQFKNWIDRQIAGSKYIEQVGEDYRVQLIYNKWIEEWYHDKLFIFDNDSIAEKDVNLLEVMERAALRNECRVFLIDNLMTSINDDGNADIYRQQSNFMKSIILFARKFNVFVFLICHPRKSDSRNATSDDVAGSSNITNLAHCIIDFAKRENEDGSVDRLIRVLKNRNTGKLHEGIQVLYQEDSKRISGSMQFDWLYGWEDRTKFNSLTEDDELDLPFEL